MPLRSASPSPTGSGLSELLFLTGITKAFPGVQAIKHADLNVRPGEIHALVGENGAGKSTLIKVVTGAHAPDSGQIKIDGREIRITDPTVAYRAGVAAIYQEFNLVPAQSIRANLFLGREKGKWGVINEVSERTASNEIFTRLGVNLDSEIPAGELSIAHQQLVEIARALLTNTRLLIMDEPTAALSPREVEKLFAILLDLRAAGHGIIFISHRLDEVFQIADRVTVMRDGATIGCWPITSDSTGLTRTELIEQMVGRPLEQEFPKISHEIGKPLLSVKDLAGGRVHDVSFSVRRGEVLGIAGLVGAGRSDVARLIFGADKLSTGEIFYDGKRISIDSPRDAINQGICLLTEDRKRQGLVLDLSALENVSLPNLNQWSRWGWISRPCERDCFDHFVDSLNIKLANPHQKARHLSGGNQQKLLIARWLENDAQVILFDEPTRGIDVGAKYEMYLLINELAARGKAIVVISSELPEIIGMSDRILVMHEGRISGEITDVTATTQAQIMELAVG